MKRMGKILAFGLLLFPIAGCTKPTTVQTIKTPFSDMTLTFETWKNGPLVSDRTKLVAHYFHGGKEYKSVVFDGDYVIISKYLWTPKESLVLCYKKGTVANFTNEVGFPVDGGYHSFHVILKEDC
jgi:hypothetical protein